MSRHLSLRYGAERCLREFFWSLCAYATEQRKYLLTLYLGTGCRLLFDRRLVYEC
jgi:hypothetical protein